MTQTPEITFGDNVRVLSSPVMDAAGHSGRIGQCWGFTTPSATGMDAVDGPAEDIALSIHLEDEAFLDAFFRPEDLELIDHDPGLEVQIGRPTSFLTMMAPKRAAHIGPLSANLGTSSTGAHVESAAVRRSVGL